MHTSFKELLTKLEYIESKVKNNKRYSKQFIDIICSKFHIKKENIPNSYYLHQEIMMLNNGYGHIKLTEEEENELADFIIKEQKASLTKWLNYLIINEPQYPLWFRVIAISCITKIGNHNIKYEIYHKRRKNTITPFIGLNKEALSLIYSFIIKNYPDLNEETLLHILKSNIFTDLYIQYLRELNITHNKDTLGIWKTYEIGSDPNKLVDDIIGKGTGWCIAGIETAKVYLKTSSFDIYYTKDSNNNLTTPRIAIRYNSDRILEARGIEYEQNIEEEMIGILDTKLNEFNDYELYKNKIKSIKLLTKIYNEYKTRDLTIDELKFLYEINEPIITFEEVVKDVRITEILEERNNKEDLSKITGIPIDNISTNIQELLNNKTIIYYGNIDYTDKRHNSNSTILDKLGEIKLFLGDIDIYDTNVLNIKLPQKVMGVVHISEFKDKDSITLPEYIGYFLDLVVKKCQSIQMPKQINLECYMLYDKIDNIVIDSEYKYGSINKKTFNELVLRKEDDK